MQKKFILLIIVAFMLTSFVPPEQGVVGKVTFPLGNVLVLSKGDTRFRQVTFNMPVKNGDKIETRKKSRCELTYVDGSIVRIDEQSIYTVEKVEIGKESRQVLEAQITRSCRGCARYYLSRKCRRRFFHSGSGI